MKVQSNSDPEGVAFDLVDGSRRFDPFRVGGDLLRLSGGVAPAIDYVPVRDEKRAEL